MHTLRVSRGKGGDGYSYLDVIGGQFPRVQQVAHPTILHLQEGNNRKYISSFFPSLIIPKFLRVQQVAHPTGLGFIDFVSYVAWFRRVQQVAHPTAFVLRILAAAPGRVKSIRG